MTIKEALTWGTSELKSLGISEPHASAEVLLSDVLNLTRTDLLAHSDREVNTKDYNKFQKYLKRRQKHEPVWQIIGKVDFWGMSYVVNKDVLVPRPETEILVKEALKLVESTKYKVESQNRVLKVLDLGTGSGTIIIALASELKECSFFASDVSFGALTVAKKNAKRLVPKAKIKFKKGDLFKPWKGEKFDIICANLPYIPSEDMASLAFDLVHHEPRVALEGGQGGLEIYKRFFTELSSRLEPGGAVFCEIGINQGKGIEKLAQKYLPGASCKVLGDLAGIDRVVIIRT
jgi:release factor glutamine methyltransferase